MTSRRNPDRGISGSDVRNRHIPVLLSEVIERLAPQDGQRYIDATFGAGGYTSAILEAADCSVLALDRDPSAVRDAFELTLAYRPRLSLMMSRFSRLYDWACDPDGHEIYAGQFDGVVFDLGVSSMQLDRPERGFSFQADGPLDMRMDAAGDIPPLEDMPTAAEVVNTYDETQIADIIFQLGEEKRSRAIARAIVARRETAPFERTLDLADVIEKTVGGRRGDPRHPATRTFQALRIFVNDELGQLLKGLAGAERCLKPGGRLVVVTFHSLEDRIVKRFLASRSGRNEGVSRHLPEGAVPGRIGSFRIVNHRSLTSSKGEAELNPRARSARLRSGIRTEADAWPLEADDLGLPGITRRTFKQ